jgi:hypothetical protein
MDICQARQTLIRLGLDRAPVALFLDCQYMEELDKKNLF